jgi:hypothetical protein
MTKNNCIASISTALTNTASWRLALDGRYPDRRNARAARNLSKLAVEAASLTDAQFAALDFDSPRWNEALRQASRLVGYKFRKVSLNFFVRILRGLLSEPATVA